MDATWKYFDEKPMYNQCVLIVFAPNITLLSSKTYIRNKTFGQNNSAFDVNYDCFD